MPMNKCSFSVFAGVGLNVVLHVAFNVELIVELIVGCLVELFVSSLSGWSSSDQLFIVTEMCKGVVLVQCRESHVRSVVVMATSSVPAYDHRNEIRKRKTKH